MGRFGPAFLAYPNFKAFLGWNSAMVYSTTVAYYATRLNGAPALSRTGATTVVALAPPQVMELQRLLIKQGYEGVGEVDGKFGAGTRAAVKKAQMKVGLPADSYPTAELIERLRGGRPAAQSASSTRLLTVEAIDRRRPWVRRRSNIAKNSSSITNARSTIRKRRKPPGWPLIDVTAILSGRGCNDHDETDRTISSVGCVGGAGRALDRHRASSPPKKPAAAAAPARPAAPAARPAPPAARPAPPPPAARAPTPRPQPPAARAPAFHPAPAARIAPPHPAPHPAAVPLHLQAPAANRALHQHAQTPQLQQQAAPRQVQRQERALQRSENRALRALPPQQRAARRLELQNARAQRAQQRQAQPNALTAQPSLAATQSTRVRSGLRRNGSPRVTVQAARQGRFASAFTARAQSRNPAARGARVAAHQAWRRGQRAGFVPWYGPVFWPYAYSDIFDYTFWPDGYDDGYWACRL